MKVVAFNGSARPNGNCTHLILEVFRQLRLNGIETEVVQLSEKQINPCSACYQCHKNRNLCCAIEDDDLNACIFKMMEADGIILASPTYIGDVSSMAKALIDRAGLVARSNTNMFRRKLGAAIVTASWGGAIHAFDSLNHFFLIGEMILVGSSNFNLGFGREEGQVLEDRKAIEAMKSLGRNMSWLLDGIRLLRYEK